MLTHYMKPEDILREFWADLQKVTYWMNRQQGGERKRAMNAAKLYYGILSGFEVRRSEMYFYDSPQTGNRWVMWDRLRMGHGGLEPTSYRVCYRMLEQYMCMMVPTTLQFTPDEKPMNGVTIYTPHLFQRMHERLGVDMSDRLLTIRNFSENLVETMMDHRKPRGQERHDQIVCRLPGSWLRGHFVRVGREYVITYRTYYTDHTLTSYQRRELMTFRRLADRMTESGDFARYVVEKKREISYKYPELTM